MKTAIDTSILFDLLLDDPQFATRSSSSLMEAMEEGPVVVCPVTYAELAAYFVDRNKLDSFLSDLTVVVDPFRPATLHRAGQLWKQYANNRGKDVHCARCGRRFNLHCPECGQLVAWRQHLIPDFLIGAHAELQADRLLARDRGYYREYFPNIDLLDG